MGVAGWPVAKKYPDKSDCPIPIGSKNYHPDSHRIPGTISTPFFVVRSLGRKSPQVPAARTATMKYEIEHRQGMVARPVCGRADIPAHEPQISNA